VARVTSRPGRSARLACRDSTITRWLSWKSVWIRRQSASASGSTGAADRRIFSTPQLPFGVGLVDDLPVPGPLGNCRLILVAFGVRRGQCSAGHARAATRHPRPFALDDPDRLARLLADAELAGVAVTEVPVPLRDASFDAWWTRTSALAGPLAKRLALLPETARRQLRARLQVAVQPYQTPTGLDLPGVSLLAAAHRTWRHQG
jgi:hypothetical protein